MSERYNLIVIGGGAAGLISAYMSAAVRAKVALIERHKMGGDCLNYGCVPSKALIRTARFVHDLKRHKELGVKELSYSVDLAEVMDRVQTKIQAIEPHDSVERYRALGVDCIQGQANILSPHQVRVGDRELEARNIILAVGASPIVPALPGFDSIRYLTSENLWQLRTLPKKLVVLGGGPIGCEMAQAFARLGSEVVQVERASRLLIKEDPEIAVMVSKKMQEDGVRILCDAEAVSLHRDGESKRLLCKKSDGSEEHIEFDEILFAVGRRANTNGVDWAGLGIELNANGTFKTDAYLRTTQKNIYACGDAAGPFQLTHAASHQAWYCAMNALFAPFVRFKADYRVLPRVTFTDPEIAQVGINELEAKALGVPYEIAHFDLSDLDRAIAESEAYGAIKVLTVPGKDRILGVTICGHLAGELIGEFALAMKQGIGLRKILGTVHAYPTHIEANKAVAGVWAKAHVPAFSYPFLRWFHHRRL